MSARLQRLRSWSTAVLGSGEITPVSGDASFRRYFRLRRDGRSYILMDAPPEKEDSRPFVQVATLLAEAGLHVPAVLEADLEDGFLLLSDLGETLYLARLERDSADALYGDALAALLRMHTRIQAPLPAYDEALLRREMALFPDWYLARELGREAEGAERAVLDAAFDLLAETALAQPRVFVHRDYHSRNLMLAAPNPGILDFQDAVWGPITYDLVSLLRDCYIAWPRERVERWMTDYHARLRAEGLVDVDRDGFRAWFDLMGIQRHLKASGIFARLWHRDGKSGYLKDIPRTLGYICSIAADYPELAEFGALVARARAAGEGAGAERGG